MKRRLLRIYRTLFKHFGPQRWWPAESPFEVMIGAILTQNTSWKNVEKAVGRLKQSGCLSPSALRMVPHARLAAMIRPAGYFNVKARRIRSFLAFFFTEYQGNLKRMFSENGTSLRERLLSVSGIGPETADSILLYAGGHPIFVVDNYTRRILARHRLVGEDIDYHSLQEVFMKNLPRDPALFNEYHALLVKVGKDLCKKDPLCSLCPLYPLLGPPAFL